MFDRTLSRKVNRVQFVMMGGGDLFLGHENLPAFGTMAAFAPTVHKASRGDFGVNNGGMLANARNRGARNQSEEGKQNGGTGIHATIVLSFLSSSYRVFLFAFVFLFEPHLEHPRGGTPFGIPMEFVCSKRVFAF